MTYWHGVVDGIAAICLFFVLVVLVSWRQGLRK